MEHSAQLKIDRCACIIITEERIKNHVTIASRGRKGIKIEGT